MTNCIFDLGRQGTIPGRAAPREAESAVDRRVKQGLPLLPARSMRACEQTLSQPEAEFGFLESAIPLIESLYRGSLGSSAKAAATAQRGQASTVSYGQYVFVNGTGTSTPFLISDKKITWARRDLPGYLHNFEQFGTRVIAAGSGDRKDQPPPLRH